MKKTLKKTATLTVAAAMVMSMAGCGSNTASKTEETSKPANAENQKTEAQETKTGDNKLSIFGQASVWLPNNETDISSSPFLQKLMENTGVDIELTAISGDVAQQFNLMVAGGRENLPDIIDNVNMFDGGAISAYESGYIIDLTDLIDTYAPNYKKYLEEHPDIDKLMKTEDGKYLTFPMVRGQDELCSFNGLIIRKDWLEQANLEVPVTMEEWHNALTVFKNDFGATAPLVIDAKNRWHYNNFASAYGTMYDFFQKDGQVVYGPMEPGFKDFLAEMNRWYEEGLIDTNYLTADKNARDAAISSDQAGAMWGAVGGGIGKFIEAMETSNPEFELVGAPTPVLTKGEKPMVGFKAEAANNSGMAITTNCKNVELAMKFLDYGYSEEGNMLYNYGIEGESYEMVNGEPIFTDLILHNPDGLTMSQAMSYYIGASHMNGGFVQEMGYYMQYLQRPQQREAITKWADTDAVNHLLPTFNMTPEETDECASIDTAVWTYVDESVAGFITGTLPLDGFEAFVEEIKDMDIERSIEIKQAAMERFYQK